MLSLTRLAVDHGKLRALWDVSMHVGRGERVALLGANGAGKSTAMGAIVGRCVEPFLHFATEHPSFHDAADGAGQGQQGRADHHGAHDDGPHDGADCRAETAERDGAWTEPELKRVK